MAENILSSNASAGNLKKSSISGTKPKPRYMADTFSSSAKYRTKVPIAARSGFVNIIKNNPGIPTIPSVLPEKRNFKLNHLQSEYKQESIQSADSVALILAADSETSNNLEQVQSVPSVALIHDDDSVSTNDEESNHSSTRPLPSPSRRGGVMAATIASIAKQRAKFQGAVNINGVARKRWNSSPKLTHIKPPMLTTWEDVISSNDDNSSNITSSSCSWFNDETESFHSGHCKV